ncbi:MBL fold metallo-hydrolase [Jiangella ureilytica]|uniref:MBL fold metallo-hydrolase n=1 Tax=Jiangella ureilytica TaxID=2530374 RepID=A0A4R4RNW0_9ACTN|nr:MBL fold metallo-hydrolase [Jiangella ureilytica]TDC50392.1 MBL fold metallo-hydrolase [Jiangella ureilytica]
MPLSMTFVGTATMVLRLGDFTVLTDPNFLHRGQRVHLGYGLFSKRRTEPAMQPDDLPPLTAVLLSHLHGDHFDRVARSRLPHELPIVTTPHAAGRLRRWGFEDSVALETWTSHEFTGDDQTLRITSVPGTHGPGLVGRLLPPVMGSIVEVERAGTTLSRFYITGDTLYRPTLREITERFPALDAMVIHLGGTRALGVLVTMDHRQGADLVELIAPPITIPIHYNDYTVFRSPLADFIAEVRRRRLPGQLRTVQRGQTIRLPSRERR